MYKQFTFQYFKTCLIILFAGLLVLIACKKEQRDLEQVNPKQQALIQSLQNAYTISTIGQTEFNNKVNVQALGNLKDILVKKPSNSKLLEVNTQQTYAGFTIITDSVKVLKAKGHTSYIFRVKLSSPRASAFQNLTIDESAEGTRVFVNTYTPSKKWIANWRAGKAEKFEGDIDVVYLNTGLPLKSSTTNKTSATNITIKYAMPAEDCTTTTYYEYLPYSCASGNHGPDDAGCYLTGNDAAGYYIFDYTVTNCNGGGGGGGGGSTTPNPDPGFNPCDSGSPDPGAGVASTNKKSTGNKVMIAAPPTDCDPLPLDCAGVPGGSAYIDPNCNTCIGGSTGITECPTPPPSCRSFNFSKVANNWQTAGVKNIFQTYVDLQYKIAIQIEYQPLYFQMPYQRSNGQNFTESGIAATKSAEILQDAFQEGFIYFTIQVKNGKRGEELKTLMERKILEYADNIMNARYGGNVTKTPPLGFNGGLTNYRDYYFFPDDCIN